MHIHYTPKGAWDKRDFPRDKKDELFSDTFFFKLNLKHYLTLPWSQTNLSFSKPLVCHTHTSINSYWISSFHLACLFMCFNPFLDLPVVMNKHTIIIDHQMTFLFLSLSLTAFPEVANILLTTARWLALRRHLVPFMVNSTSCIYSLSCTEPGTHFLIYGDVLKDFFIAVLASSITGTSAQPVNAVYQNP